MAKYNLDSGFLVLYDWMPALESMTYEEVGKLLFALIDRQRYDKPLPEFDNAQTSIYARMIEPVIKRRLEGQENANKKHTRSADHVPTPVPIPEQGVLRKEEKREEEISIVPPPPEEDTEEVVAENANKKHTRSADHVPTPAPIPEQGLLRKEEKRKEEISGDTLSPPAAEVTENDFEQFWEEYPKHSFRKDARTAYFEEVHTKEDHGELMALLREWKESAEWKKDRGKWVKRGDNFLRESFSARVSPYREEDTVSFDIDEFFDAALSRSYSGVP